VKRNHHLPLIEALTLQTTRPAAIEKR